MIPPSPPREPSGEGPSPEELEAARFVARVKSTRPIATYSILAVLAAIFAAEMALGGSDSSPTLAHMGANVVERTRGGELERVLSASTLHAGPAHAFMNLYVLWALGRTVEALIGRSRFLVLYVLSALGGGLGTTFFSSAVSSVGASGAMWGLLGAMGVLAFRPAGLVPARVLPTWRRTAMTNLGLNVLISFSPGIDLWAHLGGGVAGALLVGSGVLTAGLSLSSPPSGSRLAGAWAATAGVLSMLLFAAVGIAWARGRPWELVTGPSFDRRSIGAGATAEIPTMLSAPLASSPMPPEGGAWFGDVRIDPYVLVVVAERRPAAIPDAATRVAMLTGDRASIELLVPPGVAGPLGPSVDVSPGGSPGVVRSWRRADGLIYHRAVVLVPTHDVLVEMVAWPEYEGSAEIAARVAGSVAPVVE